MADPGFPRGGGANSKGGCENYNLANFFPKTAWNWKNLDSKEGARPWYLLRSTNAINGFGVGGRGAVGMQFSLSSYIILGKFGRIIGGTTTTAESHIKYRTQFCKIL